MYKFPEPRRNRLLAALPDAEWCDLLPQLERVELSVGKVLSASGAAPSHVYFPTTAIISLITVMENGVSTDVSVVGNEGVCGLPLFLGGESTTTSAVVRSAGVAYRLDANEAKTKFRSNQWRFLLLRYTQALMTQISQTAACNRHHSLNQQLCRWLLVSLDRLPTNELSLTHDLIANMLNFDQENILEALLELQKLGLIRYTHDHITVLDRAGLEARACECYRVVKKEYEHLLPPVITPENPTI